METDGEAADGFVEIVSRPHLPTFLLKNPHTAIQARGDQHPSSHFQPRHFGRDSLVPPHHSPVLPPVCLDDISPCGAHIVVVLALRHEHLGEVGLWGGVDCGLLDGAAVGAADVVQAQSVGGVYDCHAFLVVDETAVDVVDGHLEVELVVSDVLAPPAGKACWDGLDPWDDP